MSRGDKQVTITSENGSIPFLEWLVATAGMQLMIAKPRGAVMPLVYDHEKWGRVVTIMGSDGATRFHMHKGTKRAKMRMDPIKNIMALECVQYSTPNRIDYVSLTTREGGATLSQLYRQWQRHVKAGK